jgi:hypothetical protein
MTHYTVTVTRDEDLWAVHIGGLPKGVIGAIDYVYFSEIRAEVPEVIADLTACGVRDGFTSRISSATPQTNGAAMLVPLYVA